MDDDVVRAMVARLSRRHPSGGKVVERAAILADGADLESVMVWIVAHDGQPEGGAGRAPARYVLPAGARRAGVRSAARSPYTGAASRMTSRRATSDRL